MSSGPAFDRSDSRLCLVQSRLRSYPDFPKAGILFYDVFSVLGDKEAFPALLSVIKDVAASHKDKVDVVVGLDARGFIFAPIMAEALGVPFVPIRKKGKLPGECSDISYDLEYGSASFAIQKDAVSRGQRVLVVDDLLATGGTMKAACDLLTDLKTKIVECFVIIELVDLKGRDKIKDVTSVQALFQY